MTTFTKEEIAKKIQHTNVNPDLNREGIISLCNDCIEYNFDGVMLQPCWIEEAKKMFNNTDIKVCTALGFPMGGATTASKVKETENVFKLGADQLDFMANVGFLKSKMYDEYKNEIKEIVHAASGKVTKIMLEFGMLTQDEKEIAAELALEAGVTYLKNSSGWGRGGKATVDDIQLLKKIAGDKALVKASGGIRSYEDCIEILNAGASLIGTSAGVKILTGTGEQASDY
ncbi:deoxyribose-phosphate aldolase [Oceanobacillus jeddahense]|uniref:Deoxyribose-phosphate aldolase n=1 Tax=Oceanobacillus jeddahense TaxID=1462527 RepID=A0ABY5JRQ5_9BACI|nr:deoxyribose-phosphate aldolase [Oceanobacillus jeddahense]UUI02988.1 deoxyribose-phosphate aldolase [Oceanobacillus jeddahense]